MKLKRGLLIFRLLTCLILLLHYCIGLHSSAQVDCFTMPDFPMFGSLEASGSFAVSITCPEKGQDLPMNAPGEGGLLHCEANKPNYDLFDVSVPDCLPVKAAKSVVLPFLLIYTTNQCPVFFEQQIVKFQNERFPVSGGGCGSLGRCTWSSPNIRCDENLMFDNRKRFQIDVDMFIQTFVVQNSPFATFMEHLEALRDEIISLRHARRFHDWETASEKLMVFDVGEWTASCNEVKYSQGTVLKLHNTASCRGCPQSYFFNDQRKACQQCPYNFYTLGPFSSTCIECPPEMFWGSNRTTLLLLCYGRT